MIFFHSTALSAINSLDHPLTIQTVLLPLQRPEMGRTKLQLI